MSTSSPHHPDEPDADAVHRQTADRLRADGQRYTEGRRRLVDLLTTTGRPVSLPELVALDPDLPQSSAYRNLDLFERTGVVRRIVGGGEHARFELAEPLLEHHHHLICAECGAIEDVTFEPHFEDLLETELARSSRRHGFTALHHTVDVHGRCAGCTASRGEPDRAG